MDDVYTEQASVVYDIMLVKEESCQTRLLTGCKQIQYFTSYNYQIKIKVCDKNGLIQLMQINQNRILLMNQLTNNR